MRQTKKGEYSVRTGTDLHAQCTIYKSDWSSIECDKGIADIICTFNHWGAETVISCENDDGHVLIIFRYVKDIKRLFQLALKADFSKDPRGRTGLLGFFKDKAKFQLGYQEGLVPHPKTLHLWLSDGTISERVALRFDRKHLALFRRLLFRVFKKPKMTFRP